jgi:hypothetical protein
MQFWRIIAASIMLPLIAIGCGRVSPAALPTAGVSVPPATASTSVPPATAATSVLPTVAVTSTSLATSAATSVPRATADTTGQCQVNVDELNLRGGPSLAYDVIQVLDKSDMLIADARSPDQAWLKVRVRDSDVRGWVSADPSWIVCAGDITALSRGLPIGAFPPPPSPIPSPVLLPDTPLPDTPPPTAPLPLPPSLIPTPGETPTETPPPTETPTERPPPPPPSLTPTQTPAK